MDCNGARQRIQRLYLQDEGYCRCSENAWRELWIQYWVSLELPEEDVDDTQTFDLLAHITFLREHIDKKAM